MGRSGRTQRPEPRESPLLVGAGEPAVADDIGDQDRGEFARIAYRAPPAVGRVAQMPVPVCLFRRKDRSRGHCFRTGRHWEGQQRVQKLWGPRQRSGTVVVVRKPIEVRHDPS
jgi:hypothetical protein